MVSFPLQIFIASMWLRVTFISAESFVFFIPAPSHENEDSATRSFWRQNRFGQHFRFPHLYVCILPFYIFLFLSIFLPLFSYSF